MKRGAVTATLAPVVVLASLLTGCSDDEPPPPAHPAGLVLEVDGIEVWEAEITKYYPYLDSVNRREGRNARIRAILSAHVLPLKLAQRAFKGQRSPLQASCAALRRVIADDGYPALVAKGAAVTGDRGHLRVGRYELPLPLQMFAFDPESTGQVSPVLELPQGFALISAFHVERGSVRTGDIADAFQVPFYTHEPVEFGAWLTTAQAAVAGKVSYVHPDYRAAMPPWLTPLPIER